MSYSHRTSPFDRAPLDVETVLSRAVSRALNVLPSDRGGAHNVDKPRRPRLGPSSLTDHPLQMRLLAEQIVKKVERKYEEKIREMREKEQTTTERRLREIREEYEREREMLSGQMERDRRRHEDMLRDRERIVKHQIEMKTEERESKLQADRRALEIRFSEFLNTKEQFERVQNDFRSKIAAEYEQLELEKERIARKGSSMAYSEERARRVASVLMESEKEEQLDRIRTLEMRITELTKKLADAGAQNFELRQTADANLGLEAELQSTKDSHRRLASEVRELTEKLRKWGDYEEIEEEKRMLKKELNDVRHSIHSTHITSSEMERKEAEHRLAEEASALKIRELRMALTILNDRVKTLSNERNYLQGELKILRKEKLHRSIRDVRVGREREENSGGKTVRVKVERRYSVDSDCSSVSLSSGLSNGDSDIRQIRKRIRGLDRISKELDQTADQFLAYRSVSSAAVSPFKVEHLDDFCRNRASVNASRRELSLDRTADRSRVEVPREVGGRDTVAETVAVRDRRDEREKRERIAELAVPRLSPRPSTKNVSIEERVSIPSEQNKEIEKDIQRTTHKNMEQPPQKEPVDAKPVEDDFAERLRLRQQQKKMGTVQPVNREIEKSVKATSFTLPTAPTPSQAPPTQPEAPPPPAPSTSADNPLFEGVDPVMAEYMALVMKNRNKEDTVHKSPQVQTPPQSSNLIVDDDIEVPDLAMDNDAQSDGDFDW